MSRCAEMGAPPVPPVADAAPVSELWGEIGKPLRFEQELEFGGRE